MKRILGFVLALLLFVNTACAEIVQIDVLSLNDWHGHLRAADGCPGAARLGGVVQGFRDKNPSGVLLLGAGDMFSGSIDSDEFKGLPVVSAMNEMKFAADCIGNHTFDYDMLLIRQQAVMAKFPLLAANITSTNGKPLSFKPYTITEASGVKIGVIGVIGKDAFNKVKPGRISGLEITAPEDAVNKYVPLLKNADAEVIIVLAHIGSEEVDGKLTGDIVPLLEKTQGVDAFITGDSHIVFARGYNGIPVIQAGEYGKFIGHIKLDYSTDDKKITGSSAEVYNVNDLPPGSDAELARLLVPVFKSVDDKYNEVLAQNPSLLNNDRQGASPVGDYFMDLLKTGFAADIALYNGGAVRAQLPGGDVTLRNLKEIFPFNSKLYMLELKGSDILAALEHGITGQEISRIRFSGIKITADLTAPEGKRIRNAVLTDGSKLESDKYYSVVTNDFMAEGGDGYASLAKWRSKVLLWPEEDTDFFANRLRKFKTIDFIADDRLIITGGNYGKVN